MEEVSQFPNEVRNASIPVFYWASGKHCSYGVIGILRNAPPCDVRSDKNQDA